MYGMMNWIVVVDWNARGKGTSIVCWISPYLIGPVRVDWFLSGALCPAPKIFLKHI